MSDFMALSRKQLIRKLQGQLNAIDRLRDERALLLSIAPCPACGEGRLKPAYGMSPGLRCEGCGWQIEVRP